jgi:hypothetical protein
MDDVAHGGLPTVGDTATG